MEGRKTSEQLASGLDTGMKIQEPLVFGLDIGTRSVVGTVGYKKISTVLPLSRRAFAFTRRGR